MTYADPIIIVEYDPAWPGLFEAEASRLGDALGSLALRIDHVGSTAVPGLAAKPVIDIQISVKPLILPQNEGRAGCADSFIAVNRTLRYDGRGGRRRPGTPRVRGAFNP